MTRPMHSSVTHYRVTYAVPVAKAGVQRAVVVREQRADLLKALNLEIIRSLLNHFPATDYHNVSTE